MQPKISSWFNLFLLAAVLCLSSFIGGCGGGSNSGDDGGGGGGGGDIPGDETATTKILVKMDAGIDTAAASATINELASTHNFNILPNETLQELGIYNLQWKGGASEAFTSQWEALGSDSRIEFAELDSVVEAFDSYTDPDCGKQWALPKVDAQRAWTQTRGDGIVVAVVDTGIDLDHPEWAGTPGKLIPGFNFIAGNNNADDDHGHGTHCAGIIGAPINNKGIIGTAPDVRLMPVKVLNASGSGSVSSTASGIKWAADHGADVISMSFGGPSSTDTQRLACEYAQNKGVILVAAAANTYNREKSFPAAYADVISVAATDRNDAKCDFSTYGSWVTLAAPGKDIYSTFKNGTYTYMSGTSMACPHVSGAVALYLTKNPGAGISQVTSALAGACDDIGHKGDYWKYVRLNTGRLFGTSEAAPVITSLTASRTTLAPGESCRITATATGSPAPTISWAATGGSLTGTTGSVTDWKAPSSAGTYSITATAKNSKGQNSQTIKLTVTAPAPTLPTAPTNFRSTGVETKAISLAWNDNSNNETEFRVYYVESGTGGSWKYASVAANKTTFRLTGLDANATYILAVKAVNAMGAAASDRITVKTASDTLPAAPTNFRTSDIWAKAIGLAWNDNSNNEDEFRIYYVESGTGGSWKYISVEANATKGRLTGLKPGAKYIIAVKAVNTAGAAASDRITVQTKAE